MKKGFLSVIGFAGFRRYFVSNIQEQEGNYQKHSRNLSIRCNIYEIVHFSKSFSILTTTNKSSILKKISPVKAITPSTEIMLAKFGVMNATPNQPADRLINNPERARSHGLVKKICTDSTLTKLDMYVNFSID